MKPIFFNIFLQQQLYSLYEKEVVMIKILQILLISIVLNLILFSSFIFAQIADTSWTKRVGGPGWQDNLTQVIATQDNNYVASGVLYDEFPQGDIWLIKFNDYGDIIWNKTFITDTAQPWLLEGPRGMIENENGEVIVFAANSESKHFLLTVDTDGNLTKVIKYMDSEDPYYIYCALSAADNGFIVAGDHAVAIGDDWVHYSWFRKIDDDGNMEWEKSFAPINWQDRFYCGDQTLNGGFILAGTSDHISNYDDIFLCLITAQGDTIWTKRWGTTAFDYPHEISQTSDGGFIIGGTTSYMSSYDGLLLKLDPQGNEEWNQTYNSYNDDEIHSVKPTADNGFIITGQYKSSSENPAAFWVIKTDQLGNQVAEFSLDDLGSSYGQCIIPSNDGGYIAVGKLDDDGFIVKVSPNFGSFGVPENSGKAEWEYGNVEVFPNPTTGKFRIQSSRFQIPGSKLEVDVVDIYGKVVTSNNLEFGIWNLELDITDFPAGVYFLKITADGSTITKKIIRH
jgi:hypothetical protein